MVVAADTEIAKLQALPEEGPLAAEVGCKCESMQKGQLTSHPERLADGFQSCSSDGLISGGGPRLIFLGSDLMSSSQKIEKPIHFSGPLAKVPRAESPALISRSESSATNAPRPREAGSTPAAQIVVSIFIFHYASINPI